MFKKISNPVVREIADWAFHIAIAVAIGLLIVNFVVQRTVVNKQSMEPNLYEGDNLWVEKVSSYFHSFHRGDIVTVYYPEQLPKGEKLLIKRIIGLPGDKVEIKNGKVNINGKQLKEKYLKDTVTTGPDSSLTVPKGKLFVLGDNRGNSKDSRMFGPVEFSRIRGRAIFRFFPFNKMGLLPK